MIDCIATPTQAYPIVTLSPHGQVEYNPDYPLRDILLNDTQNIYAKRVCSAIDEDVIASLRTAYEKAEKFLAMQFPVLKNKYGRGISDGDIVEFTEAGKAKKISNMSSGKVITFGFKINPVFLAPLNGEFSYFLVEILLKNGTPAKMSPVFINAKNLAKISVDE